MLTASKTNVSKVQDKQPHQTKVSKLKITPVLFTSTLMAAAKRVFFVFMVLAILTSVYSITRGNVQHAQAATPATLNFQARLMTSSGNLVPDGNYNIEFKLYNTSTSSGSSQGSCTGDANCLWTETRTGGNQVQVKNGYLSAYLGDVTALPSNIWDQQLWLTMNIGGTGSPTWDGEMTPRIRMTSVPYAFQAKSSETLNKNTGSFTGTVDFATLTADRRYLFPDTSLATTASPGTICVYNGTASNCPAASGSAYYIQNDTVVQTQSNFNIQGRNNGVNGTVVGAFQGAADGQTVDLVQFKSSGGTVLGAVTSAGNLQVASAVDTLGGATLSIGAANATAVTIADAGVVTTVAGELVVTEAFSANGGATITGVTDINTTGTAVTTIGNATAGIVLDGVVTVNETATFNEDVTIAAGKTIRLVGGATAQRPVSPTEGMVYFDTDTDQLLIYANGKWQADRTGNIKVVASSTASQAVKDAADYVADGTNDEVQINQALTAGAGGMVHLTGGTFTVASTILVPNNTVLTGAGQSTIVQLDAGSSNVNLIENGTKPGTGIIIRDMKLDGSLGTGGTQHGIYFDDMNSGASFTGNEIERVQVENWANGHGLYIDGGSVINGVTRSAFSSVYAQDNSVVINFTYNYMGGDITLDDSSISSFSDNIVSGATTVQNNGQLLSVSGNFMGALTFNNAVGALINNNTIGGIVLSGVSSPINISANRIGRISTDAISITNSDEVRITDNVFYDDSGPGHAINITDAGSNNTYIAGNDLVGLTVNDSGTDTVYLGQVNTAGGFVVQPAGDVLLNANTQVTGDLTVTGVATVDSLDVTNDAAIGGNLTVNGTITVSTLGATNTDAVVCLNSSNQLAACNSTFLTAGDITSLDDAFLQGGNAFGASAVLGTTDNNELSFIANNITALTIDVTGNTTFMNDTTFNGSVTVAANQTLRLTGGVTGNRPGSPTEGMMYFDTTTKQLLIYANGKWQADTKTATFVVAASNSSQSDKDGAQYVADGEDSSGSGIGTLDGDQVQINNALNAAEAAGGGVVYLAGGTYTIDATIAVPNNVTLAGSGTSTLIRLGNFGGTSVNINAISSKDTSTGTNVTVRDLRVDGRNSINTAGTQYGIVYTSVGNTGASRPGGRISNVVIDNFRDYSIYLSSSSSNVITSVTTNGSLGGVGTTGSSFTNVITANTFNGGSYGVSLGAGGNLVSNNVLTGNTVAGVYVLSALNNITGNVIGNTGGGTTTNAIHLSTASGTDNVVTNNTISDTSCSSTCYAINIDAAAVRNYLADNNLGTNTATGTINNQAGASTNMAGQLSSSLSGNYMIQPAGTIELMKNTNVTGNLSPTTTNTYDLGTSSFTWRTGYFGTSVLTPLIDRASAGALGIGTTNATNITIGHNAGTFAVDGTNFDLGTNGVMTLAGGQTADITTQANQNLTVVANGSGIINLNDNVTVGGTLTLSGAVTDITTATNEDLTVVANGTGIISLNDTVSVAGNFTVTNTGNVAFQRNTTDYTATGTQNDVNFGSGVFFRITSASAVTITSIAGGADGRIITLANASANTVTLNNDAGGTAANRIITGTGGNLDVPAGSTVQLAYDSADLRWRIIGGTATGGGGANRQLSNLSGTVAINLGLVPAAASDNALDLGSATYGWRSLYADTSVLTPLVGRATAGTLAIGTDANSTAVTISRTGVTTSVAGALSVAEATQLSGGLTVTSGGNVAFQRNTTNITATGTQNDLALPGGGTGALFRITSASALTITSIAGGTDGRIITFMNASANTVTLNNDAGGTAANRIITGTGGNLDVPAGSTVQLAYDSGSSRWRIIGGTATAGGAANQQLSNLQGTVAINASLTTNADNTLDLGSPSFSWRTVYADTSVLTALLDAPSATALNIGTTNATQINLNKNTVVTGNVTLAQGADRELRVEARGTAGVGYNLTIAAGAANGSGNAGGALLLQGGAAVAGNANGGAITIAGGAGAGTGSQGLVNLSTTAFSTSPTQSFGSNGSLTAAITNIYSTIPVSATTTGVTVTVDAPSQATVGRILYLSNVGSNDFNILLAGTGITIALKPNTTATLIWNGNGWTAAGASSSTDLQSAYNNTLTSAGGAEIILNPTGGAADGFTIRNNATTPIVGGLLEVQSSIGTNLFSVNSAATEWAANGGAETSSTFGTNWTTIGSAGAPGRTTSAGQYVTGQAGVSSAFGTAAGNGVRNNLATNPTPGDTLQISFTAKLGPGSPISDLRVDYTPSGASTGVQCTSGQSLSTTEWTKITCEVVAAGAVSNPDILIYQVGAAGVARTIYIDNLSVTRANATDVPSNVQIGGGINGGQVTLFTLDRSSSPPVEDGNTTYYGSMYYDTTTGRIQCYEADGWGACGSPPDNIITLTPEYTGAVLNGNGVGVMTADFCGDGVLNVNAAFCGTGEARNYYRWTSPQNTSQSYSIYVNYKLPSTFKSFADANTMKITTRSDDLSLARADLEVFRKASSGGVASCGAHTTLNDSANQWQQKTYSGNETSCNFQGGDYIIFKVTVHSSQGKNIYIENIDFTYLND